MPRALSMLLVVGAVVVFAAPASAADWTDPVRVDRLDVSGLPDGPSVAVHAGATYVAVSADGIVLLTDRGGGWARTRITAKVDEQPSMGVDADGHVHIAFARAARSATEWAHKALYYATDGGGSWVVTRVHTGDDFAPSLALTADGQPQIAFLDARGGILLSTLTEAGWATQRIAGGADFGYPRPDGPSLAVHGSRVYVVFRTFREPETSLLRLVEVEDGAVVRRSTVTDVKWATNPDIAVDDQGRVHIAFAQWCHGLWYAQRDAAGTWSGARVAPRVAFEYRPSIALVSNGQVAIVAEGGRSETCSAGGSGEILFRTNVTGTWTGGRLAGSGRDRLPDVAAGTDGEPRVLFLRETRPASAYATLWITRPR